MKIVLNGEPHETADGSSVNILLAKLKLSSDKVAVELNKRLLRGDRYDQPLKEGDALEIVTFVGGG